MKKLINRRDFMSSTVTVGAGMVSTKYVASSPKHSTTIGIILALQVEQKYLFRK